MPPQFAVVLRALDVDACHISENALDGIQRDAKDVAWIPRVAERGWTAVTGDLRIWTRPEERLVREKAGLVTVFMHKDFPRRLFWEQAAFLISHWPKIEKATDGCRRGQCFRLNVNGKIEVL